MAPAALFDHWESNGELFDYPPELCIRNTFIDGRCPRMPSLDGFIKERRVRSCPSSGVDNEVCEAAIEADVVTTVGSSTLCVDLVDLAVSVERRGSSKSVTTGTGAASTSSRSSNDPSWDEADLDADGPGPLQSSAPTILSLGSLLAEETPQEELRNKGSMTHGQWCKPCAFFHTRGCESGADCEFCHICEPGAKKMRKKEKHQAFKMRNSGLAYAGYPVPPICGMIPVGIMYL